MIREEHRPDKKEWCRLIKLATDTISNGKLNKTVLARATDLHFEKPINPASMLNESRKQNLHCYHFYMAFDPNSAFLGSSPERLWRRVGKSLQTEALAGTAANHNDDQEALRLGMTAVISSSLESSLGLTQLARVAAWLTPNTNPCLDTLNLMRYQQIRPWPQSTLEVVPAESLQRLI